MPHDSEEQHILCYIIMKKAPGMQARDVLDYLYTKEAVVFTKCYSAANSVISA